MSDEQKKLELMERQTQAFEKIAAHMDALQVASIRSFETLERIAKAVEQKR